MRIMLRWAGGKGCVETPPPAALRIPESKRPPAVDYRYVVPLLVVYLLTAGLGVFMAGKVATIIMAWSCYALGNLQHSACSLVSPGR
jgi:hypothetical protein